MSHPERQHYLPRFYLEGFAREGWLWLYDRSRDGYRRQRPINIAVRRHYYTVNSTAADDPFEVEAFLGRVEERARPVLVKVDHCDRLSSEERAVLSLFSGLLMSRVPQFQENYESVQEELLRRLSKEIWATPERAKAVAEYHKTRTGEDLGVDPLRLREFALGGEYTMSFPRELSIATMIEMAKELTGLFVQMDWVFYHPTGEERFITSDSPLYLTRSPELEDEGLFGAGVATPGVRKVLPLSGRSCLVMGDKGESVTHRTLSKEEIAAGNLVTARNCHELVVSADRGELERVVNEAKLASSEPEPRVKVL